METISLSLLKSRLRDSRIDHYQTQFFTHDKTIVHAYYKNGSKAFSCYVKEPYNRIKYLIY